MKYLIGITASESKTQNFINTAYVEAFNQEEVTPILIPNLNTVKKDYMSTEDIQETKERAKSIAKRLDALILSGGGDLNPLSVDQKSKNSVNFNMSRDITEKVLVQAFIEEEKPILGICRGFQLLGNMYNIPYFQQSLNFVKEEHNGTNFDLTKREEPVHSLHILGQFKEYCKANKIEEDLIVNSWHHQGFTLHPGGERINTKDLNEYLSGEKAVKQEKAPDIKYSPVKDLEVILTTNHVLEGFEVEKNKVLAVQFHPKFFGAY